MKAAHPLAGRIHGTGRTLTGGDLDADGVPQVLSVEQDTLNRVLLSVLVLVFGIVELVCLGALVSTLAGGGADGIVFGGACVVVLGAMAFTLWVMVRRLRFVRRLDGFAREYERPSLAHRHWRWDEIDALMVRNHGSPSERWSDLVVQVVGEKRPVVLCSHLSTANLTGLAELLAQWSEIEWVSVAPTHGIALQLSRS